MQDYRVPSVLVPYTGPCSKGSCSDVFVYLRPETNGMQVESTLLRIIKESPEYKKNLFLSYLANIPGDFIVQNHIIEDHYSVKLYFAVHGRDAFTGWMQKRFSDYFGEPFEKARIVGAFEALRLLDYTPSQLFSLWVPKEDMCIIHGQNIKRKDGLYIINYDLPELLHKNNRNTDIAVMIFRITFPYHDFHAIISDMGEALVKEGIIDPNMPLSRVFHYSKGPFEQVLDGIGHLYQPGGSHVPIENLTFSHYMMKQGYGINEILGVVRHPVVLFGDREGLREEDIFTYTTDDSYREAMEKFSELRGQCRYPDEPFDQLYSMISA